MDEIKAKQQIVEKIKEVGKILVTVSNDPSVDALSAALGLAMILDKQEKYSTAIFSGQTPPAIAFLEPEKTFDDTTDSLRDFIIALNKEKADHLRYKVEGDSVKIFITPYKTTISEEDLVFSQGDYNVELVIALGVSDQAHLDKALEDHGQILHDATIVTMTAGDETSTLGGIDWHDSNSSSLSEMVAGLAEALKDDKKKTLLTSTSATALLTGIVAATDRFSNEHTTSKVMTVAASLMAAGADQQLIATELQKGNEIGQSHETSDSDTSDDSTPDTPSDDEGIISINKDGVDIDHSGETLAELDKRVRGEEKSREKIEDELEAVTTEAKHHAEKREEEVIASATPHPIYALQDEEAEKAEEPTFGAALNATTEQAAEDARSAAEDDQNKTILSHAYLGESPTQQAAPGSESVNSFAEEPNAEVPQGAYAFDAPAPLEVPAAAAPSSTPIPEPPIAVGGERVIEPLTPPTAPAAPAPSDALPPVQPSPADLGLPLPPPLPDFSQGGALPPAPAALPLPPNPEQPAILGDILSPEAPVAPTPVNTESSFPPAAPIEQPSANPGQFQIPGQPQ